MAEPNKRNLVYYLSGRVIIVSILTFATIYISLRKNLPHTFHIFLFLEIFLLAITISSFIILKKITTEKSLRLYGFFQVFFDIFFYTFSVYPTGTVESPFVLLYFYTLIFSPFFLSPRMVFIVTGLCIIFFGGITDLIFFRIIPSTEKLKDPSKVFPLLISYSLSFGIVSFLSYLLARQLKKAQEEIQEKDVRIKDFMSFFKTLLDNTPSGVLVLLPERGKIIFSNPSAVKILGEEVSEGRFLKEEYPEFFNKIINSPLSVREEITFSSKKGRKIFGFSSNRVSIEGYDGLLCVFQDLTEIKKREEEIKYWEWSARLGELAASIAHEVRNPLTTIMGCIEYLQKILSEKKIGHEAGKFLQTALQESQRIKNLVSDFLYFTKTPNKTSPLNLKEVVERAIFNFPKDKSQISLTHELESVNITGDENQLIHLLYNLLDNAVKFSEKPARVHISLKKDKNFAVLSVSDKGKGIKEEDKDKIFLPFFTTDKTSGTGMGLAIVKRIVENHGGKIDFTSEYGKGTTFNLYFPILNEKR